MDSLVPGSGGTHDPGMEMRMQRVEDAVARIEVLLKSLDDRMRRLEIEVAELKGRITNMPSTWQMMTAIMGGQVAFAAVCVAIVRFAIPH